jgi:organic hydroperoxide reductase OsmC/OhrA
MTKMTAEVHWERGDAKFTDSRYSRDHSWRFDGGQVVPASSSPHVVPLPYSIEANVDPEEAYIAALSSCHMLFYLSLAAAKGLVIESYTDKATGVMEKVDGQTVVSLSTSIRPSSTPASGLPPRLEGTPSCLTQAVLPRQLRQD